MIYQLHEFQKTVMAPAVGWADTARHLFTNPLSPLAYTPLSRTIAANSEMFVRLMRRYPKPEWGIDEAVVNGERVSVTCEVVIPDSCGKGAVCMTRGASVTTGFGR